MGGRAATQARGGLQPSANCETQTRLLGTILLAYLCSWSIHHHPVHVSEVGQPLAPGKSLHQILGSGKRAPDSAEVSVTFAEVRRLPDGGGALTSEQPELVDLYRAHTGASHHVAPHNRDRVRRFGVTRSAYLSSFTSVQVEIYGSRPSSPSPFELLRAPRSIFDPECPLARTLCPEVRAAGGRRHGLYLAFGWPWGHSPPGAGDSDPSPRPTRATFTGNNTDDNRR